MPLPTTQLLSFSLSIKAAKKKRQKNQLLIKATVHSLFFKLKDPVVEALKIPNYLFC